VKTRPKELWLLVGEGQATFSHWLMAPFFFFSFVLVFPELPPPIISFPHSLTKQRRKNGVGIREERAIKFN
jgi:hypothetical protein